MSLQQERADRQQAQAGAEGADRSDGLDAERFEAERDGGEQDQNEGQHAPGVPELTGLINTLSDLLRCEPDAAVPRVRRLINQAPAVLTVVQTELIRQLAREWTGTPDEFCKRYDYTRQRLHQMGVRWRKS